MKTSRMVKTSVELKKKEIRGLLNGIAEGKWEDILRNEAINGDPDPECGDFKDAFKISIFESNGLAVIECTAEELYEADEDGEFISGSDFDWKSRMTSDQIEELKNWLN